jgi:hypothetical protein
MFSVHKGGMDIGCSTRHKTFSKRNSGKDFKLLTCLLMLQMLIQNYRAYKLFILCRSWTGPYMKSQCYKDETETSKRHLTLHKLYTQNIDKP